MSDLDAHSAALLAAARRLIESQRPAEAVAPLLEARRRAGDHPAILEPLAAAHCGSGQMLAGLHVYDRLIELNLATAATWCAAGNALVDVGEYAQAIGAYERSLEQRPANPEARHNLARARYRLGEVGAAVHDLRACTSQCDALQPWLSLATIIPGCPEATAAQVFEVRGEFGRRLAAESAGSVRCGSPVRRGSPDPAESADRPVSLDLERPPVAAVARSGDQPQLANRPEHGRLRIGYVSACFHRANYMKPVWGLIDRHDRAAFQVNLFSDSPPQAGMPGYRPHKSDRVYPTGELTNEDLAAQIAAAGIDVLVDLNAYSAPERLALFTRRICPVTMAWFNMYATSGLPAFDYLVGDDEVVRPDEEPFYDEQILRLPLSYLTFQVDHPVPEVVDPPCLRCGQFTFGSLVSQYKITPPVLDAWSAILRAVPHARLLLANAALKSRYNREYVQEAFARRGVGPGQIELRGPAEHLTFLGYYDEIDLALDAFPYNGGTTTMEALWQGVPVLAPDGDRWAARTSQTLLRRCALGAFVAADVAGYVAAAVRWATDRSAPERLGELRRAMRAMLSQSSACDTAGLARGMETLYRQALRR